MNALHVPPTTDMNRVTLARQVRAVNDVCLPTMAYTDAFYEQVRGGRSRAFVVLHLGQPVGAVMYRPDGRGLYIQTLGVLPAYKGQHIATGLVAAVLRTANGRRVALEVQMVNHRARTLYTRLGFHNTTDKPGKCYTQLEGQEQLCFRMEHTGS